MINLKLTLAQAQALCNLAENSLGDEQDIEGALGTNRSTWDAAYRAVDSLNKEIQKELDRSPLTRLMEDR